MYPPSPRLAASGMEPMNDVTEFAYATVTAKDIADAARTCRPMPRNGSMSMNVIPTPPNRSA